MTWTVAWIVVFGAAAGLGAVGLLLAAVICPDRRLVRVPRVGVGGLGGRCPCCGYSTEGLEEARCPECGGAFDASAARAVIRRRRALGGVGLLLAVMALSCIPLADAARFGAAHAAPSIVLVQVLRLVPSWHGAITRELQGRADAGQLGTWTSASLAQACAAVIRNERDASTRRDAAWLLARVASEADPAALRAMVEDRDAAVRAMGVEGMRLAGGQGAGAAGVSERLNRLVLDDASAVVRKRAIEAMRYRGDDGAQARSTMLLALDDPNDGVRQRALLALSDSRQPTDDSIRAVGARTKDSSEEVRWMAALTLGKMAARRPDAVEALAESLDDASPMVRVCAVMAIGEAGAHRAWVLPRLLGAALGDEDEVVRGVAMDALRAMRG